MYPPALAEALQASGIEASTVADVGLAGTPTFWRPLRRTPTSCSPRTSRTSPTSQLTPDHRRAPPGGTHCPLVATPSSRHQRHRLSDRNRGQRNPPRTGSCASRSRPAAWHSASRGERLRHTYCRAKREDGEAPERLALIAEASLTDAVDLISEARLFHDTGASPGRTPCRSGHRGVPKCRAATGTFGKSIAHGTTEESAQIKGGGASAVHRRWCGGRGDNGGTGSL